MLQLLHIENIAIIEQADIAFEPGFNVLTPPMAWRTRPCLCGDLLLCTGVLPER